MAANTFGSPVVFHNKTYPSASVALDEYISNYDNHRQLIRSKYDQEIQNLFLSTPSSSADNTVLNTSRGNNSIGASQRALMDSSVALSRVAIDNTSTLPSAGNSEQRLNQIPSTSTMTTDELLAQKPMWKLPSVPKSASRKPAFDTSGQLSASANLRHSPAKPHMVGSRSTMQTDSLINAAPAKTLLDDSQSVATEYLLDVARSGAERALNALTPNKSTGQSYLTEQQLQAIKRRIDEQMQLAENLRASIRHIEESQSSSSGNTSRGLFKSAEAEDVLHSRLYDSRRKLYETMGISTPLHSSLPESFASSGGSGRVGVNLPSWVHDLENQSDTSSIISGNLMKQRKMTVNSAKMASTPMNGKRSEKRIRFEGTTSTIQPNDTHRSRAMMSSTGGASFRSKSAAGRLTKDRWSESRTSPQHDYSRNMSASTSRSSGPSSHSRSSGSGSVPMTQGQPIIGRGFQDIDNEKHRDFIKSLQQDIQDSKSSIAASTFSGNPLMDSIPHAMKDTAPDTGTNGLAAGKDHYMVRVRDLMSTPPPEPSLALPVMEKSPDTDVILSGDRPWEKAAGSGQLGLPSGDKTTPSKQAGTMETLKHMLFSLQSFAEPTEAESANQASPLRDTAAGVSNHGNTAEQSAALDDSTAELLRKTAALTSDMENKLAPLMYTIGSSSS